MNSQTIDSKIKEDSKPLTPLSEVIEELKRIRQDYRRISENLQPFIYGTNPTSNYGVAK